MKRRGLIGAFACIPFLGDKGVVSIPGEIQRQIRSANTEAIFRATCTAVHDTSAGGFTVAIKRAGQENPDPLEYRYIGPAPSAGDDVIVYQVGASYIAAGIDETVIDRNSTSFILTGTTAETDIYSKTIAANKAFTTIRGLRILFVGTMIDPAAVATCALKVKVNGVQARFTINSAAGDDVIFSVTILPRDSLNSQIALQEDANIGQGPNHITALAVDATLPVTISVTGQLSSAAATVGFERKYVLIERR